MVAMEAACFDDSTAVSSPRELDACLLTHGEDKGSKARKYELVDYDSLPNYLKHNEFILSYYRSNWPWKETILSIFSIHNETINVWTHLIGFLLFLALTVGMAAVVPIHGRVQISPTANATELHGSSSYPALTSLATLSSKLANETVSRLVERPGSGEAGETEPITRWPFMAFMAGAMVCLLTSSACHLLSCHSECCSYVMLRLDYAGICTLIVTSFYPLVYYSFLCDPFYQRLYISFITLFGVATALVSLLPAFEAPEFRLARASLFCCMGLSAVVPILHKLALYGHLPQVLAAATYEMGMGASYALGALLYASRVPERWLPGRFDLAGHSHQLFHVLVISGAYMHYLAALAYLQWRDADHVCFASS